MRTSFLAETERRRQAVVAITVCVLIVAAVTIVAMPRAIERITGVRRVPEIAAADDLPALASDNATEFFRERDEIEIRVTKDTTLRELLDRNRLNKPYHRQQIVEQLGGAAPQTPIAAGTVLKLRLTPIAADVPGTTKRREVERR